MTVPPIRCAILGGAAALAAALLSPPALAQLSPVGVRCAETAERFIALVNEKNFDRARLSEESVEKCVMLLKVRHAAEAREVIARAGEALGELKRN